MECLSCLESLGTRLDCCPDKLICTGCLQEKLEIKCPDCGLLTVPSEDKSFRDYLSQKFQKLISRIEKLEISYDQAIQNQENYLQEVSRLKLTCPTSIQVNLKSVELALDTNKCLRIQLESMRNVLSLSILEAYPKIKTRIKNWPDAVTVDLYPVRIRETTILSDDCWLSFIFQQDLISKYQLIYKKQPSRILEFPEEPNSPYTTSWSIEEVHPQYFYIINKYLNRVMIWDPQSQEIKFDREGMYTGVQFNGRWVVFLINGYIYFKKIGQEGPLQKINFCGIERDQWGLFQDFVLITTGKNLMRVHLESPNCFLGVETQIKSILGPNIGIRKEDKYWELFYYGSGEKHYSTRIPDQKITTTSEYTLLLTESKKIWVDNDLLEFPSELTEIVGNYHHIISTGEVMVARRQDKKYILKFY